MFSFDDVALIGVTYNSAALADHFAQTAKLFRHVWVVDNASQDGTLSEFQRAIPHAHIMALSENTGLGPANNRGFEASLAQCGKALFLNPDCQIDEASVRLLLRTMDEDASVVIASPVVFSDVTHGPISNSETTPKATARFWSLRRSTLQRFQKSWSKLAWMGHVLRSTPDDFRQSAPLTKTSSCTRKKTIFPCACLAKA